MRHRKMNEGNDSMADAGRAGVQTWVMHFLECLALNRVIPDCSSLA